MQNTTLKKGSLSRAERLRFARTLAIGMPVTALVWLLLLFWIRGEWMTSVALAIFIVGEGMALLSALSPSAGQIIYKLWYGLIWLIERTLTFVLLTTLYYLVITPIALVQRLAGRRSFLKRGDSKIESYWQTTESVSDPSRYYRQF
jgi:hypothetical protein